jgi:hypothetical protein
VTLPFASAVNGRRLSSDTGGAIAAAKTDRGLKPTDGLELPGGDVDGVEVAGRDVVGLEPVAVRWLAGASARQENADQYCHRQRQHLIADDNCS